MPAMTHGAPGSGGSRRRQRAAANEPVGALAGVAVPRQPTPPRTLVIIPAWNEEEALPATLTELASVRPDLDVLVVSDGSTDHTAAVARAAGVTVVELPFNLGIGGALQTGFRYAVQHDYDRAVQFDADGQHDPAEIAVLLDALDRGLDGDGVPRPRVNMVIGSRFGEGTVEYRVGPIRHGAMRVLRFSINAMTRQKFSDTSSGFRAFDRSVLDLFAATYPVEFMDSTESLLQACRAGLSVIETPTRIRKRSAGTPSTRNFRLVYHYLRLLVTILSQVSRRRNPKEPRS
jgi:glycosyltransferase involved in cell wall biosynthesis